MFRHVIIGAAAVFGLASAAQATVEISTTGRGLFSNVRVVGQPLTLVGPIASVTGRTAPGYTLNGSAASLAASAGLGTVSGVTATLDQQRRHRHGSQRQRHHPSRHHQRQRQFAAQQSGH